MIKSPWVWIHEKLTTGVHGVGSDYVAISKSATLPALNAPLGTAEWANRTYAGWELFDTAHTYTVGSGEDFETLAAAAASLQGLILLDNLTLQLTEDVTLTEDVEFKNILSAGGMFRIDMNGYDINIDDGCIYGVNCNGQFGAYIYTSGDPSTIKMVADSVNPPYYTIQGRDGCVLQLITITLDANNKAHYASVRVYKAKGRMYVLTFSNNGSLVKGDVYANQISHVGFTTNDADSETADGGSIIIDTDGTVVTT